MSQICKQHKITNQRPSLSLMQRTKNGPTSIRFMQIGQCCQCYKNKSNSSHSSLLIRNTTKNCVYPKKIPFGNNMSWCRIRVCWNIIIRVSLNFWIKRYQKGCTSSQYLCCSQIFRIKVRKKINLISLGLNSQRIGRSILMLCCKMNQAQSPQLKRKQIMKTIKTIQCRIIYTKTTP